MQKFNYLCAAMLIVSSQAFAAPTPQKSAADVNYIRNELQQIINVNLDYQKRFHELVSQESLLSQTPDATVVLCSDSRVDLNTINESPAGQLFVIRNIGNQVQTAYGSVEYGVNHLHTPILLVMGHSECGAVKAAMHDFSNESANLQSELSTMHLDPKATLNANIVTNVNNQVAKAMDDFKAKMTGNDLIVIGMVYDLHNDYKLGNGKLIIVNVNNQTDPKAIANNQYIKGLKNVAILGADNSTSGAKNH